MVGKRGHEVEWRNGRCFVRFRDSGGVTILRIDPATGTVIDISGQPVVNSDVAAAVLALRATGEKRNTDLVADIGAWWRVNRPDT
jgi:hypothetical protein